MTLAGCYVLFNTDMKHFQTKNTEQTSLTSSLRNRRWRTTEKAFTLKALNTALNYIQLFTKHVFHVRIWCDSCT